jgi:hypothetical protein
MPRLSPAFLRLSVSRYAAMTHRARSAVFKKIPAHRREQNVMRNHRASENIGA